MAKMARWLAGSVFLLGSALTIGCAGPAPVTLSYQAQPGVTRLPGAEAIRVKVVVKDLREQKGWVCAKSGQLLQNARQAVEAMPSRTDPAGLVSRALKAELGHRGFDIDYRGIEVDGSLVTFLCHPEQGLLKIAASVEFDLSVYRAGHGPFERELYHRFVAGEYVTPDRDLQRWTVENATIALEAALADAMKQAFDDRRFVATLLNSAAQSPTTGRTTQGK
jgi:hypothetical protein